ncbi:MAG: hypothetical protein LBD55_11085, partial [Treponema sp.]|nr:hypothetical protein [Treponema sp.]
HEVKGHVWGDRFFSKILDSFKGFLPTSWYETENQTGNPVKAQRMKRAGEWEFGGLWHFL